MEDRTGAGLRTGRLTLEEKARIRELATAGHSVKAIAADLCRQPRTVRSELDGKSDASPVVELAPEVAAGELEAERDAYTVARDVHALFQELLGIESITGAEALVRLVWKRATAEFVGVLS